MKCSRRRETKSGRSRCSRGRGRVKALRLEPSWSSPGLSRDEEGTGVAESSREKCNQGPMLWPILLI